MTTETTDHPGGYAGAMEDFYREAAERIAAHLDAGRDVALLAEGDPLFYSSYMHMHTRLTRAVRRGDRARRDVGQRCVGGDRHSAGPGRRGADDPARHPARRRTQAPAGRHRRRRGAEARPLVSRCAGSAFGGRTARRRVLRGARQHTAAAGAARRRRRRRNGAVLLAGDAAGRPRRQRRSRPAASRSSASAPATPTG